MAVVQALSLDPAVADVIAAALALLLGRAAFDKFSDGARFRGILESYGVLPASLAAPAAAGVPLIEGVVAGALLLGCFEDSARKAAGLAAAVLLLVYGTAIAVNLLRGRTTLDCGCTPAGERRPIGAWMVARNALLAALALLTTLPGDARELGPIDAPLLIGGLIACVALYSALDTLFGRVAPVTAALRGSR
ncbi:MAG: MauE/DoxX family redox-associated membrane protein [Steroidobacteraceae bacterium]